MISRLCFWNESWKEENFIKYFYIQGHLSYFTERHCNGLLNLYRNITFPITKCVGLCHKNTFLSAKIEFTHRNYFWMSFGHSDRLFFIYRLTHVEPCFLIMITQLKEMKTPKSRKYAHQLKARKLLLMVVSTSIGTDDAFTTMTQSVDGSTTTVIPKNYFMTSKGIIRLNDRDKDT